ncbi:MAG: amidohydrolase family protein [Deltaproteobacteria bacterium]|nr:amidohydrolase family protein [Deltaproteobacteria bacterium]
MDLIIENASIITMDNNDSITHGSLVIEAGIIKHIGNIPKHLKKHPYMVINAEGNYLLPGFIQTHIHTGQTLFRGMVDDLELLDWLSRYIWPLEMAHNETSVYESARLSILEMISSGTTTFLDIGLVHHTESIIRALYESGIRGIICKMLMDKSESRHVPYESLDVSEAEIRYLFSKYHNLENGRIMIGIGPRFALSLREESLIRSAQLARELGIIITTHSSENIKEITEVRDQYKDSNISLLNKCGILSKNSVIAHCIWLEKKDFDILLESGASVAHCPGSNLKLGSGFAKIPEMLDYGINVTLGADGAPCNNNLSILNEIRLASLIHKPRIGPQKMDAKTVLKMATINGAKALGLEKQIGSIEVGKKADLIIISKKGAHINPIDNPYSAIVYSSNESDIKYVIVSGKIVYKDGIHFFWDSDEIVRRATEEKDKLLKRL